MGWINIVSNRFKISGKAKSLVEQWETFPESNSLGMKPGLLALIAGDRSLINRSLALANRSLEFLQEGVDEKFLGDPTILPDLVGLSVLAYINGHEQSELWQRIANTQPFANRTMKALQSVIINLVNDNPSYLNKSPSKLGHVTSASDWLNRFRKSPTPYLFDLAISPDHPLWSSVLSTFVLPLGILLEKELKKSSDHSVESLDLFRLGAHPQDYGDIIYERQHERPSWDSIPDTQSPETWLGFDAVELCNQELYVYHYLGLSWQAPLLFDDEVNAYQFLDQLDKSWRLVEMSLNPVIWKQVEELVKTKRCVHIVVHDSPRSPCLLPHLERAAKHYDVNLEVRDVTLA